MTDIRLADTRNSHSFLLLWGPAPPILSCVAAVWPANEAGADSKDTKAALAPLLMHCHQLVKSLSGSKSKLRKYDCKLVIKSFVFFSGVQWPKMLNPPLSCLA